MRVANLDMTDPNQNCPEGLRLVTRTEPPLRTCGRPGPAGCVSTTYSTYGVEYSKVCGRIIAYQSSTPDAFDPYFDNRALSIDDVYVDGVSLTHGQSPRQHIWTFANALDETRSDAYVCPCTRPDLPYTGVVPPFIGQDYFCETGSRQAFRLISSTLMIHSGMVRDAGVPVLAVSSTIHRGSASNSLNQLQTISS